MRLHVLRRFETWRWKRPASNRRALACTCTIRAAPAPYPACSPRLNDSLNFAIHNPHLTPRPVSAPSFRGGVSQNRRAFSMMRAGTLRLIARSGDPAPSASRAPTTSKNHACMGGLSPWVASPRALLMIVSAVVLLRPAPQPASHRFRSAPAAGWGDPLVVNWADRRRRRTAKRSPQASRPSSISGVRSTSSAQRCGLVALSRQRQSASFDKPDGAGLHTISIHQFHGQATAPSPFAQASPIGTPRCAQHHHNRAGFSDTPLTLRRSASISLVGIRSADELSRYTRRIPIPAPRQLTIS